MLFPNSGMAEKQYQHKSLKPFIYIHAFYYFPPRRATLKQQMQSHFKSLNMSSGSETHISSLTVSLRVTKKNKKKGIKKNITGIKSTYHLEEGGVASCSQIQNGLCRDTAA